MKTNRTENRDNLEESLANQLLAEELAKFENEKKKLLEQAEDAKREAVKAAVEQNLALQRQEHEAELARIKAVHEEQVKQREKDAIQAKERELQVVQAVTEKLNVEAEQERMTSI